MGEDFKEYTKKGTTTVGIVCKDGIVLAADKRVTLGGQIVSNKKVDKIVKITDSMALTTAGSVSDIQLVVKLIRAELNLRRIREGKESTIKEAVNLLGSIVYQNIRKFSPILAVTGFLVGGKDDTGFFLYNIGPDGSVMIEEDYSTVGSGMVFAYGVLDTLYKPNLPIQEGIKLGVKAVNAAMQRDTATGEGIDVITITKEGVKKVLTKRVDYRVEE
jgi:proteasome beta subunit